MTHHTFLVQFENRLGDGVEAAAADCTGQVHQIEDHWNFRDLGARGCRSPSVRRSLASGVSRHFQNLTDRADASVDLHHGDTHLDAVGAGRQRQG